MQELLRETIQLTNKIEELEAKIEELKKQREAVNEALILAFANAGISGADCELDGSHYRVVMRREIYPQITEPVVFWHWLKKRGEMLDGKIEIDIGALTPRRARTLLSDGGKWRVHHNRLKAFVKEQLANGVNPEGMTVSDKLTIKIQNK